MNNSKKYLYEFVVLLIWIFVVVLLFKLIPVKKIAAVVAGLGFILWPFLFFLNEIRSLQKSILHLSVLVIFLVTNAIPIFLLRVLYWNEEFSSLKILFVSADQLHLISNYLYMAVMVSCLFHYFKLRAYKNKKQSG